MLRKLKTAKKQCTNYINYSTDNQGVDVNRRENRVIRIGKESVPVTEEVYKAYYQMDRHARYLEKDVKVGSSKIDPITGAIKYKPSKEDSIERLMDKGLDFKDGQAVENIVCDKAMLFILQKAIEELDNEEREIIDLLYCKNFTTRETGKKINKSHVTVGKKHRKVLEKLKKYFL
ncbi:sigma-70 family RNA polymerase sigma factor [Clostridium sporogenes]|uniref:sigma-70 family RNA polymerase sigma factor n=1 Tax=Clostridium sporogenes TaxID=1509 RepID=UPI0013D0B0FC|nr:sigma-70 family RNA polymerase sigma factor [Clostridium sporogenes]NFF65949.1 sigma-70 family RNA polymerase sigma factor [Clostridium sporogenes]NFF98338.1 sigma-70 family RNA polymerase sigma factor [Clostridium sporogenes]NFG05416.1 sigma-70 family RNA polymerase sigma factor [Clostridium sporogenes]NFG50913.1 sigma-70 family RNA polymerase sigma factor [Clostridium sporogenes]NFP83255.1 sigma-70 family RNA polymerase sigma factor [Clostridium sporogenes]